MAFLFFLLFVGILIRGIYFFFTRRETRANLGAEIRQAPFRALLALIMVAGMLAFGFGVIIRPLGMIEPFGLHWPLFAIGGVACVAALVVDWLLPESR